MAQYLIAQWDYTAEGSYELTFKEGDKIKLLEKHNDDWWEGELNDEIGFFPANRTIAFIEAETDKSPNYKEITERPVSSSNPYLNSQKSNETVLSPPTTNHLIDVSTDEIILPEGWSHSYDPSGKIYYFNETTGESQWEKPTYKIQNLNLEALKPSWINYEGMIQLKIIKDEYESSWKEYYGVLTHGVLLIYKEGLNKKRPTSFKPITPFFTVLLDSVHITPDTKRRYTFMIHTKDHYSLFLSFSTDLLYTEWLDALMKEIESNIDQDLSDLFQSISIQKQKNVLNEPEEVKNGTLTRWFSRSNRNRQSTGHELFGGQLRLEEDGSIPFLVKSCIEEIEKRGLDVVGIYRLSGQTTAIQKLKQQFNTNPELVDLDKEPDINVITGVLKLYFRELQNPLLRFEYYDRLIEAVKLKEEERLFRLKSIIQVLPISNYKVLEYLARHLERVKFHAHLNKMESVNLALIFSMSLLRPKEDDISASILHNDLSSKVIEYIINNVDWIFDVDTDDDSSHSSL